MVVAFRHHTLLPLDDCLYALQPSIPHLTRSALHRCLQRHGISRLPDMEGDKPKRQKLKRYPIGYFHTDIAEFRTNQGKLSLLVAIDRTSKFAFAQLVDKANRKTACEFLETVLEAVPYKVHTILTDNGIQFCEQPRNRNTAYSRPMRFDIICAANGIEHRLTKPNHPWTNGQVERMNARLKTRPPNGITTIAMTTSARTSAIYTMPTTTRAVSRHSVASRLTNTSAKSGHPSQIDSS